MAQEYGREESRRADSARRISKVLGSLPFLGISLAIFATTFPPLEVATDVNLPTHMLQHVLIALGGVFVGYPLFQSGCLNKIKSIRTGLLGFLLASILLIYWHLPFAWDSAVLNLGIHIIEHISFLAIGILIGTCIPMLPDNFKMIVMVMAISAHMFYGFALFLINTPVYPLYPVSQQATLGVLLFAPSPIYFIGYLYITLARQSKKLEALEKNAASGSLTSHEFVKKKNSLKLAVPALSLVMLILLLAYFSVTAVAVFSTNTPTNQHDSFVYIQEGPVYWQYSPQDLTVVIGVNNTVVWISHSFAQDTVTSSDGLFSSGAINPGGSFSYTFTQPGSFHYYCIYHAWMRGTITVLSG